MADHGGCRLLQPLVRLPGLRRSLAARLTAAAALLVAAPVACTFLIAEAADAASAALMALAAGAIGLALFVAASRCLLLRPVADLRTMVRAYRHGEPLRPPATFQVDELGSLAGEMVQTLRETNAHFARRARYDASTGALNRDGLLVELDHLMQGVAPQDSVVLALIEVRELDRWELALGPQATEDVRRTFVERIRLAMPERSLVGAIAANRFACALAADHATCEARLDDLWREVRQPIPCGERALDPTCVLASAHCRQGDSAVGLFHAAETTLISSLQQAGSMRVESTESSGHLQDLANLGLALEEAIDRGHIHAHYQPRVDAASGHWHAAEALARWHHAERGPISPATFIPLAVRSGRIVELGRSILDQAAATAAAWARAGTPVRIGVNVDADQLLAGTLEADVVTVLRRHRTPPECLELELTETSLLADLEGAISQLAAVRRRGVAVALDDFGTGYSSLGYLGRLPVDRIKIDRAFIGELDTDQGHRIVRAIIDLAQNLSLATTAEGVETHWQAQRLRRLGCGELQGFLYARALEPEAFRQAIHADTEMSAAVVGSAR